MKQKENGAAASKIEPNPVILASLFGRDWEARFNEPALTSDAGLMSLVSSGIADDFIADLSASVADPRRDPRHSGEQLLRQRIFQIIGGYYDAADSDQLRNDTVMRTARSRS